jgi:hypothetical protein
MKHCCGQAVRTWPLTPRTHSNTLSTAAPALQALLVCLTMRAHRREGDGVVVARFSQLRPPDGAVGNAMRDRRSDSRWRSRLPRCRHHHTNVSMLVGWAFSSNPALTDSQVPGKPDDVCSLGVSVESDWPSVDKVSIRERILATSTLTRTRQSHGKTLRHVFHRPLNKEQQCEQKPVCVCVCVCV